MKVILSEKEQKAFAHLAGKFVKNAHLLVADGQFEVHEDDAVEFIEAVEPILDSLDKVDGLVNSAVVRKSASLITGKKLPKEEIKCKEKVTQFFVRAYEYKMGKR